MASFSLQHLTIRSPPLPPLPPPTQVKDVYLHPEQFTIENGLLTPTLKAKRNELKVLFQPQIDKLYADLQ